MESNDFLNYWNYIILQSENHLMFLQHWNHIIQTGNCIILLPGNDIIWQHKCHLILQPRNLLIIWNQRFCNIKTIWNDNSDIIYDNLETIYKYNNLETNYLTTWTSFYFTWKHILLQLKTKWNTTWKPPKNQWIYSSETIWFHNS